ncbi:hypothetical protein RHAB21_00697 [Pseudorhizobium halotolerans]|uniref:Uncharacterized protein n=1 Tax=Pseudorhizobium halotolerans TaxID=1233081 RepID=A0ABM8PYS2_9HYPH|nr:hypothetical protein [Pseudorhizobium halotolerans]CAD7055327.1 hypothetical protein RHAB21_00697 [Pseudorhizobium halotolerans]
MVEHTFEGKLEMAAGMMAFRQISIALLQELARNSRTTVYLGDIREAVKQDLKTSWSDAPYEVELSYVEAALRTVDEFFDGIVVKNDRGAGNGEGS